MWALVYKVDYGRHKAGDLHLISQGIFDPSNHDMNILEYVEIPDQDVSHLYDEEGGLHGTLADLKQYTAEEKAALIDRETGQAIDKATHPFASMEEQIGILRDQLVHVLNALGIEPTDEFARLNEIAIKEIEAAREKKEALNESDTA